MKKGWRYLGRNWHFDGTDLWFQHESSSCWEKEVHFDDGHMDDAAKRKAAREFDWGRIAQEQFDKAEKVAGGTTA